jgi:hypothetical protein
MKSWMATRATGPSTLNTWSRSTAVTVWLIGIFPPSGIVDSSRWAIGSLGCSNST